MSDKTEKVVTSNPDLSNGIENNEAKSKNDNQVNVAKPLTESEKLEMRIKKFGVQSENAKLSQRAQRFGETNSSTNEIGTNEQLLNKRAQRFGTEPSNSVSANQDVIEKRAKRFGITADNNVSEKQPDVSSDVLNKRKERFGIVDDDAKKKLRSQRFENKV